MVHFDHDNPTICAIHDKTPGSEQKKINIVVRPNYTIGKVISDIRIQFPYESFDIVFQPVVNDADLVYLNDITSTLIYDVHGFKPSIKNNLILLPPGVWDGNTRKRYDLTLGVLKCIPFDSNCNNNSGNAINNSNSSHDICGMPSPPSTMTTVTNTTTTSAAGSLNLSPMTDADQLSDDDLVLGASASPTETEPMNGSGLILGGGGQSSPTSSSPLDIKYGPMTEDNYNKSSSMDQFYDSKLDKKLDKKYVPMSSSANGYVGLVNQAMTCYLNSLLQALYMTPEFRNALYRWEFDNDNEAKNIPYQLQMLFLNLQTSKKSAVETTDLTRSFGWDSTEAWQQHDIQELCRVMFDALEHKFKNTKQANLISTLYEGKMIDYVKCLECETEKTRADTFLDIPLPVRPFGSQIAYGSIEEALRAFVQPETLDGNNQYFCEKCNKKCDAHKGLKFKNFPYILTLHLKRFDFDYQTMHRIKLNDKVTFPQTLNLNSFVNATDAEALDKLQSDGGATTAATAASATTTAGSSNNAVAAATTASSNGYLVNGVATTNTDDCSTTDSGSAMEEDTCSSGIPTTASSSQHENDMQDEDEGIDMSSSTDHRTASSSAAAAAATAASVEQRLQANSEAAAAGPTGPYQYELFAIMIHSGSASGGHYYAYIKEFENNDWFCFNDQTVSPLTEEDIQKSFGGGATKAYYSSVYSSSTNAYMLMYRQIDAERNERITHTDNLPEHIQHLMPRLQNEEEMGTKRWVRTTSSSRYNLSELTVPDLSKQRVYFYNPLAKKLKLTRVYVARNLNLDLVLESAFVMLDVEQFAPMSRCRLVGYNPITESLLQSFENVTDLESVREENVEFDFLLEYRAEGQEFEIYKPGGCTWHVYMVNLNTMEMDGPYLVYSPSFENNEVLKHSIAVRLHVKEQELLVATLTNKSAFVAYDPTPTPEAQQNLQAIARAKFTNLTYFYMNVPSTEPETLQVLGIPTLESQAPPVIEVSGDEVDAVLMHRSRVAPAVDSHASTNACLNAGAGAGDYNRRESPLLPAAATGHESNSEDSSLSDGDRTLVESVEHRGAGDSQLSSSSSQSPQLSSPEEDLACYTPAASSRAVSGEQFFHAINIEMPCGGAGSGVAGMGSSVGQYDMDGTDATKKVAMAYKIIVDSHMKMCEFKRNIAALIRVPANYFKVMRKHDTCDPENLMFVSEGEQLNVELGKILQSDEHKVKIYYAKLSELDDDAEKLASVCEWIYKSGQTVAEAKRELIAQLQRIDGKYATLTLDNCRLWIKGGRNLIKILADDETLGSEVRVSSACEQFLLQECEGGAQTQVSDDSLTLFIRRWHPDTLQLDKFQEITLEKDGEIRATIAAVSGIAEENVEYYKVNNNGCFPCTNISLLNLNGSMSWCSISATLDKYPLTTSVNGNIYFYKDSTKQPKELTMEERREFNAKEKTRLDRLGCTSSSVYSPRRERALKIYLDSSPQQTPSTTSSSAATAMDATSSKADD